jgi:hypothetical protein
METIASLINLKNLLLAALIFIPIENLLPMHEGQKVLRRAWLNDLVYALLNGIIVGRNRQHAAGARLMPDLERARFQFAA